MAIWWLEEAQWPGQSFTYPLSKVQNWNLAFLVELSQEYNPSDLMYVAQSSEKHLHPGNVSHIYTFISEIKQVNIC